MRSTLFAVGAFLIAAYPVVLLFSVAREIDDPQQNPPTAAMTFSSGATEQVDGHPRPAPTFGQLRNATLRRAAN